MDPKITRVGAMTPVLRKLTVFKIVTDPVQLTVPAVKGVRLAKIMI